MPGGRGEAGLYDIHLIGHCCRCSLTKENIREEACLPSALRLFRVCYARLISQSQIDGKVSTILECRRWLTWTNRPRIPGNRSRDFCGTTHKRIRRPNKRRSSTEDSQKTMIIRPSMFSRIPTTPSYCNAAEVEPSTRNNDCE